MNTGEGKWAVASGRSETRTPKVSGFEERIRRGCHLGARTGGVDDPFACVPGPGGAGAGTGSGRAG
ncbi:MAG TPA: hypothetical protein VFC03_01400 [Acidimicrobiales bacterium]|nr:hypothetical protein [Acidimicrobiales bacterium]